MTNSDKPNSTDNKATHLEFSDKYDQDWSQQYFEKHDDGFWRQRSNKQEHLMLRKALRLAGNPATVLDVPSGTGRFWSLLAEEKGRTIYAADNSFNMIQTGMKQRSTEISDRILASQGSAFQLAFPDNSVETVFCIRLFHHIGEAADRVAMLKELGRVASKNVIFTLWVDGNYKAWRRIKRESSRPPKAYQNRFVIPRKQIEKDINDAGLKIVGHVDFIPKFSMWRSYIVTNM